MSDEEKKEHQLMDEHFKKRVEEFLNLFKKGSEFTQELLKENEKLRYKIVRLQTENDELKKQLQSDSVIANLQRRIIELEEEKKKILERLKEVEEENRDFAQRYVEIEEENNSLANLYVASYQLHATLDFKEVLQTIIEVVINLIGGEVFGIFLYDEKNSTLNFVGGEGFEETSPPPFKVGEGIVGKAVASGEVYINPELLVRRENEIDPDNPLVVIPLKIENQKKLVGAIVIYRLLIQKTSFDKVDEELFTLLAGHAATAIFSARLYAESERKLTTFQSFMELLKKE